GGLIGREAFSLTVVTPTGFEPVAPTDRQKRLSSRSVEPRRPAQDDRDQPACIAELRDHSDDYPLEPGLAHECFDRVLARMKHMLAPVLRQQVEPFEIAESVVDDAHDLAG